MSDTSKPSEEEVEEFLLSCRFGELDEVKDFIGKYGWEPVSGARDERGNTALHMCCGNGHVEILDFVLPHLSSAVIARPNEAGSLAIHWAVRNNHISCVKALAEWPEDKGGGLALLKIRNAAGRDVFAEATFGGEGKEEVAGWIEGYLYKHDPDMKNEGDEGPESGGEEVTVENGSETVGEVAEAVDDLAEKADGIRIERS